MAPRADSMVAESRKTAARREQGGHYQLMVTLASGTLWLEGHIKELQATSSTANHCDSPASDLLGRPQ